MTYARFPIVCLCVTTLLALACGEDNLAPAVGPDGSGGQPTAGSGGRAQPGGSGGMSASGAAGVGGVAGSGGSAGSGGTAGTGGKGVAGNEAVGGGGAGGSSGASGAPAGGAGQGGVAAGSAGSGGSAGGAGGCVPGGEPTGDGATPIFVSQLGKDTNIGTAESPLQTIDAAIALAKKTAGTFHVYLAKGTYDAAVKLPDLADFVIEGGYEHKGPTWTRSCAANARGLAIVTASKGDLNAPVVVAEGLVNGVTLKRLTVKTKESGAKGEPGKMGETLIGIAVRGANTELALEDVGVVVGKGGPGGEGKAGEPGGAALCGGLIDCSSGLAGKTGEDGKAPLAGEWSSAGYVAGVGGTGTSGGKGENGKAGGKGEGELCALSCPAAGQDECSSLTPGKTGTVLGADGTCGCGAVPGAPGTGAASAGGSVGVLIGSGAMVSLAGGRLETAGGGDASEGGDAGLVGTATDGAAGLDGKCVQEHQSVCGFNVTTSTCEPGGHIAQLPGGTAGTKGGDAGKSGKGGPGLGGPSFAIVKVGAAIVTTKAEPTYVVGPGGKTGSTGTTGPSGNLGTF